MAIDSSARKKESDSPVGAKEKGASWKRKQTTQRHSTPMLAFRQSPGSVISKK